MKRAPRLYVEPRDAHTNEAIAKAIVGEIELHIAEHGKCRKVYEVTLEELDFLKLSRVSSALNFVAYSSLDRQPLRRLSKHPERATAITLIRRAVRDLKSRPHAVR